MNYPKNIQEVAQLSPHYLGFIFWKKSPRFLQNKIPLLPKNIKKVGVFVNASVQEIETMVVEHDLQAVQLHGNESVEFCGMLSKKNITVIKAFGIKDQFDFSTLAPYENVCDFYLFDTKGDLPGGNGYGFDWTIIKKYPSKKPFFLSGGIGLEQLEEIIELQQLQLPIHAIDVNSKFEISPGLKKPELIKKFKTQLIDQ